MNIPNDPIIIAVDGPAGSGKSSICKKVCSKIGFYYINTGAIYRAISLLALRENAPLTDTKQLLNLIQDFSENFKWEGETGFLFYRNENLTLSLDGESTGNAASLIAKNSEIRDGLLPIQRKLASFAPKGALLDGRDIGTVVFPNATVKIFMTASLEKRAQRRLLQLQSCNPSDKIPTLMELKEDLKKRDKQDIERGIAPLVKAPGAIELDTSDIDLDKSVEAMIKIINENIQNNLSI